MRKLFYGLFAAIMLLTASCGGRKASEILRTVPGNSVAVAVIRADELASKFKGADAAQKDELCKILSSRMSGRSDARLYEQWEYLFSEDSQMDFSSPVVGFQYKNTGILTFALKNADRFRKDFEEKADGSFSKEGNVWVLDDNTVFVCGNQAWIAPSYPRVSSADITDFTLLKESESAMAVAPLADLIEEDDDFSLFLNLDEMASFGSQGMQMMAVNMLFDDATYITASLEFDKGEVEGDLKVLDHKGKKAPLTIKASRIDVSALRRFDGRGNLFFACALDQDVVRTTLKKLQSFGSLPSDVYDVVSKLDGTMAMSLSTQDSDSGNTISGMFSFASEAAASDAASMARNQLSSFNPESVEVDGKSLIIRGSQATGPSIATVADNFDGAFLGLTFLTDPLRGPQNDIVKKYVSEIKLKVKPDGDSAKLDFEVKTTPGQNSLISLLQLFTEVNPIY